MKIAFIGQKGIPAVKGGGVETYVEELAVRLAERGHEVYVYSRPSYTGIKEKSYKYKGVNVIGLPVLAGKNSEALSHTLFASLDALRRDFDVVHYQAIGPSFLSILLRILKPSVKVVSTFHCRDYEHQKWGASARAFLRLAERITVKVPHKTITPSEEIQRYVLEKYRKRIHFIPQGLKAPVPSQSREIFAAFPIRKSGYILSVSRLVKHKGIHYLIRAHQKLPAGLRERFKLVIVGGGDLSYTKDYENSLHALARGDSRIIFTGPQYDRRLADLYDNAYLFVQPSESEGLSISLLEALSLGKPALISGIAENLQVYKGFGLESSVLKHLVFKSRDSSDLAQKLEWLLRNRDFVEKVSPRIQRMVRAKHLWDAIIGDYEKFYHDLLKSGKKFAFQTLR